MIVLMLFIRTILHMNNPIQILLHQIHGQSLFFITLKALILTMTPLKNVGHILIQPLIKVMGTTLIHLHGT